jgi:hypothetical protein
MAVTYSSFESLSDSRSGMGLANRLLCETKISPISSAHCRKIAMTGVPSKYSNLKIFDQEFLILQVIQYYKQFNEDGINFMIY